MRSDGGHASQELQLACCIRRALEGPIGPVIDDRDARQSSKNDYYWHTRETCHLVARRLGIFFPNVISLFQHKTGMMEADEVVKLSEEFWPEVQHPTLLVQEVMES